MSQGELCTLSQLFLLATEGPEKPDCFLFKFGGRYRSLSSSESLRRVAALASGLEGLGVRAGDRVALLSENRLEWALTDYAILGLGAVTVPLYPTLLGTDIEYILRDSGSKGIIVSTAEQLRKVLEVWSRLAGLEFVLSLDENDLTGTPAKFWNDIVEEELKHSPQSLSRYRQRAEAVRPEYTASILYTSGTTGTPKGVVLTHANIVSNIEACRGMFDLGRRDVAMSFLPLSHIFERMLDFYYLHLGVSIAYAESSEALPQNLQEVRPTVMAVVPRVLEKVREKVLEKVRALPGWRQRLFTWGIKIGRKHFHCVNQRDTPPPGLRIKRAIAERFVFSKIRGQMGGRLRVLISGAAPLSSDVAEFFFAIRLPVYEGYGLTETSPVIAVNCPGAVSLGTVGRVVRGVEVKLGEESDDPAGGTGREILVRGPNVTPGYYHLDEENRAAFVDGWFHTGDLGALDPDGYLTITGRKKNLFKTSGGKYVSPEKLENLFQGHRYVAQVMVMGDSRKFVGALIVPNFAALEAYAREQGIQFRDREELVRSDAVQAFVQYQVDEACRLLPPHERIRQIVLLPCEFTTASGELSATLKIKRRVVEERYSEQIEEMFLRRAPERRDASETSVR